MPIDVFCHIFPQEYVDELKKCRNLELQYNSESGQVLIYNKLSHGWVGEFKKNSGFTTPEERINHMKKYGVDAQILTTALPGTEPLGLGASAEETVKIAGIVNDALSKICQRYPDKFVGAAELPVLSPELAAEEVERAVNDLGLRGVQLFTQMGGITPDSPTLDPVYEKIQKYDLPILLHPTFPPRSEFRRYENDFSLAYIYGWPYETTLALSRIAFSGLLNRFPRLKFVSHHLGGMVPFYLKRAEMLYHQEFMQNEDKSSILSNYKLMYHDTAVNGHVPALECGYSVFGSDRVIFATDYPFGPEWGEAVIRVTLASIKALKIPQEEKEKILDGNARHLFRLS